MKFFIVIALCVAAASARFVVPDAAAAEAAEVKEILAIINNPDTDPATSAALQQLLNDVFGVVDSPISVGPAIVDDAEASPIAPGPVIVDEIEDSPISVGPAIVKPPTPSSSPLVQIIVNVKSGVQAGANPVDVIDVSPAVIPEESLTLPGPDFTGH